MSEKLSLGQSRRQPLILFTILFLFFILLIILLKSFLNIPWKDIVTLLCGNFIVFAATFGSFIIYRKSLQSNRAQYFLRMIYGAMFFKMILCMAAVLIYALIAKSQISKVGILGSFAFYFLYTFVEVKMLMQMSKQQKNA